MPITQSLPDPRVFAALGDPTRLALIERLRRDGALPITRLTDGTGITRQATAKHLSVLAAAELVRATRVGREVRYTLSPAPLHRVAAWAEAVFAENEARLDRLDAYLQAQHPPVQRGENER